MKPSAAKGTATKMQIQLVVSSPRVGLKMKYAPTALPTASSANMN